MKILYIGDANDLDYECNALFHGLVKLGHEVVDVNKFWWMSKGVTKELLKDIYGMGFSLSNLLDGRDLIDRTNIQQKINDHYFDLVIFGNCYRCTDYLTDVTNTYKNNEIVFIDGDDNLFIDSILLLWGIYFKRELCIEHRFKLGVLPISFAIPREKIRTEINWENKVNLSSYITPEDKRTYIYKNEDDYYNDYYTSWFGYTSQKGGWDCMRHYEITANGCIPYFDKFVNCPRYTMVNWPTQLQLEANMLFTQMLYISQYNNSYEYIINKLNIDKLKQLAFSFLQYTYDNLTTENLATYVLSKVF